MKRDISLIDILQLLKKRWWIVFFCGIISVAGAIVYSEMQYVPKFTSTVQVYVSGNSDLTQTSTVNDDAAEATWALKVVRNYMQVLKSEDFMEEVSAHYAEENPNAKTQYSAAWLKNSVEFTAIEETNCFNVSFTTKSVEDSYKLGVIFEELAIQRVKDITKKDAITINDHADRAELPSNSKNKLRNCAMGGLAGIVVSFLVLFIIDITDVRIKREEDIVENYPAPLLGTIPNFDSVAKKKKGYGYGYGKK